MAALNEVHGTSARFAVEPGYLDTASIGVPPVQTVEAMREALSAWAAGRAHPRDYDAFVDAARAAFAELVSVAPQDVCVGRL